MRTSNSCSKCKNGYVACPNCNGGHTNIECPECEGQGQYNDGDNDKIRQCNRCEGEGTLDASECTDCHHGLIECDAC
jgi:DnaJ-class molecular chaperone